MKKVCYVGLMHWGKRYGIFVTIEHEFTHHGKRLSITGEVGPTRSGNAQSCGQIDDTLRSEYKSGNIILDEGWTEGMFRQLLDVWDRWHLNDLRPGCEHQRDWPTTEIIPELGKTRGWVRQSEHPDGLLSKPCPVCGYEYGTKWLLEPVPDEVVEFLKSLPASDIRHPWESYYA